MHRQPAIKKILDEMARTGRSLLPSDKVRTICAESFPEHRDGSSLFKHLQTQAFMHEVGDGPSAMVRLQYERFYDVRVVKAKLAGFPGAEAFRAYWTDDMLPRIDTHAENEIPMSRLFAYALLVPETYDLELPELPMPSGRGGIGFSGTAKIWEAWLDALAWRAIPKHRDILQGISGDGGLYRDVSADPACATTTAGLPANSPAVCGRPHGGALVVLGASDASLAVDWKVKKIGFKAFNPRVYRFSGEAPA